MEQKPINSALKNMLLVIFFITIISEGVGILILYQTNIHYSFTVLFDLMLVAFMMTPILYFYVYRPLDTSIKEIERLSIEKENKIEELNTALKEIKTLRGIIPICSSCKKIRVDKEKWKQIEIYIKEHSDAEFSHGICPECAEKLYPDCNPYKMDNK